MPGIATASDGKPVEFLYVQGGIRPDGTALFLPFEILASSDDLSSTKQLGEAFSIVFHDANDDVLLVHSFDPPPTYDAGEGETIWFSDFLPFDGRTTRIVLRRGDETLAESTVSEDHPTIQLSSSPSGGDSVQGRLRIEWEASARNGESLTYSVWYSTDGGESWEPLAVALRDSSIEVDFDRVSPSKQAQVRVLAAAGARTAEARSEIFTVAAAPPLVTITAPGEAQAVAPGQPIVAQGAAFDPGLGFIDAIDAYSWSSNREGALGTGPWRTLKMLVPGQHLITLSAVGRDGSVGVASVTVEVRIELDFFAHVAHETALNSTYLDHPLLNANADAIVQVTPNWNPGGEGAVYENHPIGVWYDAEAERWAIFNQDMGGMPRGAAFNVDVLAAGETIFVHVATPGNTAGNSTYLDHPLLNANADAIVQATSSWNPGGVGGVYNNRAIGVWYDVGAERWAIFNQDMGGMPRGAAFNVDVLAAGETIFVHVATPGNTAGNSTYLDHPLLNANGGAIVQVTPSWNPGGEGGVYDNHPIGVWYDAAAERWAIFNQDLAPIPVSAAFNVRCHQR